MSSGNGKRFIDKLIAASPTERRKITVLGTDMYVPPMTRKAMIDAIPSDGVERPKDYDSLFMLVALAEYEDGSKVFKVSDIDALRERVSLHLVHEIEQAVMGALAPSDKQVEEAVKSDPHSASALA